MKPTFKQINYMSTLSLSFVGEFNKLKVKKTWLFKACMKYISLNMTKSVLYTNIIILILKLSEVKKRCIS